MLPPRVVLALVDRGFPEAGEGFVCWYMIPGLLTARLS